MDYTNIVTGKILSIEEVPSKKLFVCQIDVNQGDAIQVVTNAPNVRAERIVVVALPDAVVEETKIKKVQVCGHLSEGMLMDHPGLGWTGGGKGIAALMPDGFELGVSPPSSRPVNEKARGEQATAVEPLKDEDCLFKRKPTKEEKKALAKARKEARLAKKMQAASLKEEAAADKD